MILKCLPISSSAAFFLYCTLYTRRSWYQTCFKYMTYEYKYKYPWSKYEYKYSTLKYKYPWLKYFYEYF